MTTNAPVSITAPSEGSCKPNRSKAHKFSSSSAAPGGDTASTSSNAASQYSSQSGKERLFYFLGNHTDRFAIINSVSFPDKSRRSSQHSSSSGFHSEQSGNHHHAPTCTHHSTDGHKEKVSKRRCHGNSQNPVRIPDTTPAAPSVPTVINEEQMLNKANNASTYNPTQNGESGVKR